MAVLRSAADRFSASSRAIASLVVALSLAPSIVAPAALRGADEPAKIGFENGKLQEVAAHVSALVRLGVNGKRLELSRKHWSRPFEGKSEAEIVELMIAQFMQNGLPRELAQQQAAQNFNRPRIDYLFTQLQNAVKYTSISSRASNVERSITFGGRGLTGTLETRGDAVTLEFEEEQAPQRKLEIADDGQGAFRVMVSNRSGDLLLVVSQSAAGRFAVAEIRGTTTRAESAKSFLDFYRGRRDFVEHELYPLLAHLGVGTPAASDSPEVRQAVLARLRPLDDADRRRAEELLATLDSDDFQEREKAEAELDADFARYRPTIIAAAADDSASPEARSRLKRLLSRRANAEQIEQLIDALQLTGDGPYLVKLYEAADEGQKPHVVAGLQTLTKQEFGTDLERWKAWFAEHPTAESEK